LFPVDRSRVLEGPPAESAVSPLWLAAVSPPVAVMSATVAGEIAAKWTFAGALEELRGIVWLERENVRRCLVDLKLAMLLMVCAGSGDDESILAERRGLVCRGASEHCFDIADVAELGQWESQEKEIRERQKFSATAAMVTGEALGSFIAFGSHQRCFAKIRFPFDEASDRVFYPLSHRHLVYEDSMAAVRNGAPGQRRPGRCR
jgi:hypothetical protein